MKRFLDQSQLDEHFRRTHLDTNSRGRAAATSDPKTLPLNPQLQTLMLYQNATSTLNKIPPYV